MCQKCSERPATFRASDITASEVKSAIPGHLFLAETPKSLYYVARDLSLMVVLVCFAWNLDAQLKARYDTAPSGSQLFILTVRVVVWCLYWWFQSLTFAALWLISHECGHGSFSPYRALNDLVGFTLHSFLGTPYYSWKYSHRLHHRFNGHIEKDEHYIPKVQNNNIPHAESRLWDIIEDTPMFQVVQLIFQQLLGFQSYLIFNVSGQSRYPRWTNHFNPYSVIFRRSQRLAIVLSDIGILANILALVHASRTDPFNTAAIIRLYGVPWLLLNHWIAMIVSLQHTDAALPRYRDGAYTYARGALVTVDREFLGWQGKFFLHGVAHFHVVHHFFPTMPFYHLEEATEYARKVLGNDYIACDTPAFRALWQNFLHCRFVDANGDIVFYKDRHGFARFQNAMNPKHATT